MASDFRRQLLEGLADGEWHRVEELEHPVFQSHGLGAFVRLLREAGHPIEAREVDGVTEYRLPRSDTGGPPS